MWPLFKETLGQSACNKFEHDAAHLVGDSHCDLQFAPCSLCQPFSAAAVIYFGPSAVVISIYNKSQVSKTQCDISFSQRASINIPSCPVSNSC